MSARWPIVCRAEPLVWASTPEAARAALATLPALAARHGPLVGFIAYDVGRLFEDLPAAPGDDVGAPLLAFAPAPPASASRPPPDSAPRAGAVRSTFTRRRFESVVARAIEYIAAGDIFQVNLAQRFSVDLREPPRVLFDRLQHAAPAAFGACLEFGDLSIVSNSPELFLRTERAPDGSTRVTNRPIKGTRPRRPGMDEQLRHSVKDQAELAMIVDLQRNDLGRVCRIGSVQVVEPRVIEAHPTVYHGVATVRGTLRGGLGLSDLLRATFPCGSITGCPKIRAMQIIDELEPVARGPYCGAVGVVEPDGTIELNVAIRTVVAMGGRAHFWVGGGIVADSVPAEEYEETLTKARALADALGIDEARLRAASPEG